MQCGKCQERGVFLSEFSLERRRRDADDLRDGNRAPFSKTASAGGRVTSETTEQMRHSAFFSELSSLGDSDSSWRAVTAGLVVLRLVDAWVEEGAQVVTADNWGVRSVRAAIDDLPPGLPAR